MTRAAVVAAVALFVAVLAIVSSRRGPASPPMQFTGPNIALEQAIQADDAHAVDAAIAAGADANARGALGVTPLEYAVGTFRKQAVQALIRHHADPNRKDDEGDTATTIAAKAYVQDHALLGIILDAGGDPNARFPNGTPLITRFGNDHDLDAVTYLHRRGADVDAIDDGQPLVVGYAFSNDWDTVWHLIQLGARTDTPKASQGLVAAFRVPGDTYPDSPLYPAKVNVWRRLKAQGLNPTPPAGM